MRQAVSRPVSFLGKVTSNTDERTVVGDEPVNPQLESER